MPLHVVRHVEITQDSTLRRKRLNNIEIIKKLGQGQYGKVIMGCDLRNSNRYVAIKEILRHLKLKLLRHRLIITEKNEDTNNKINDINNKDNSKSSDFTNIPEKILGEVIALQRCLNASPHIIKLYSIINDLRYEKIFLVLEYCELGEVKWLSTPNSDSNTCQLLDDIIKLIKQVVLGLEFLKLQHIIHRDIKPSNLLVDHHGNVKISDFGSSYIVDDDTSIHHHQVALNSTVGTPMFLPPELVHLTKYSKDNFSLMNNSTDSINDSIVYNSSIESDGDKDDDNNNNNNEDEDDDEPRLLDYKLDIWSFGVTIYCILFNCLPFEAEGYFEVYNKISYQKINYPTSSILISNDNQKKDLFNFEILIDFLSKNVLIKNPNKRSSINQLKLHSLFGSHNFENDEERVEFLSFNDKFAGNQKLKDLESLLQLFPTSGLLNFRVDSLKTINTTDSKDSIAQSSVTSKTVSFHSNSQDKIDTSYSIGNISALSKETPRMVNSASNNSISQVSETSYTTNNSKKNFNKLRKTFSKLKLLRSVSASTDINTKTRILPQDKGSSRIPNSSSKKSINSISDIPEQKQNAFIVKSEIEKQNQNLQNAILEDFEKPSFSKLIRKKSLQLLYGSSKSPFRSASGGIPSKQSIEELNSPIKFKYTKRSVSNKFYFGSSSRENSSIMVQLQPKISNLNSPLSISSEKFPTVKLVDANEKLMTPLEYKVDGNTSCDGIDKDPVELVLSESNIESYDVTATDIQSKLSYNHGAQQSVSDFSIGSFDIESRNQLIFTSTLENDAIVRGGGMQNFFSTFLRSNDDDDEEFGSDCDINDAFDNDDGFEDDDDDDDDDDNDDDDIFARKIVLSKKSYNLNKFANNEPVPTSKRRLSNESGGILQRSNIEQDKENRLITAPRLTQGLGRRSKYTGKITSKKDEDSGDRTTYGEYGSEFGERFYGIPGNSMEVYLESIDRQL